MLWNNGGIMTLLVSLLWEEDPHSFTLALAFSLSLSLLDGRPDEPCNYSNWNYWQIFSLKLSCEIAVTILSVCFNNWIQLVDVVPC